jgi:excisionase family DNA binding protein
VTALADKAVLTIEEAASLLRIGRSAAYAAARSGEIPTIRVGRSLRVPCHRLEAMLGKTPDPIDSDARAGYPGDAESLGEDAPQPRAA